MARKKEISLKQRLMEFMIEIGIDSSKRGYRYTADAVEYIHELLERNEIPKITKVYEILSKRFDTTKGAVERAIRYVKDNADAGMAQTFDIDLKNNSRFLHSLEVRYSRMEEETK